MRLPRRRTTITWSVWKGGGIRPVHGGCVQRNGKWYARMVFNAVVRRDLGDYVLVRETTEWVWR